MSLSSSRSSARQRPRPAASSSLTLGLDQTEHVVAIKQDVKKAGRCARACVYLLYLHIMCNVYLYVQCVSLQCVLVQCVLVQCVLVQCSCTV